MAFDFPTSPTEGTLFAPSGGPLYQFKSGVWTVPSTPPVMNISDTAPVSPVPGQLWWRSSDGASFVWFDDGTSKQWVQFNISNNTPDSLLLPERVSAPSTQANQGALYSKDVTGITELFYRSDNSGVEAQITNSGRLARNQVNISGSGVVNYLFNLLPAGAVAMDLTLYNVIAGAASTGLFFQFRNNADATVITNYRGSYQSGNAAPVITASGYCQLTPAIAINQGYSGFIQARKAGVSTGWTFNSQMALLGGTGLAWSAGDCASVGADPKGFLIGTLGSVSMGGWTGVVEYW